MIPQCLIEHLIQEDSIIPQSLQIANVRHGNGTIDKPAMAHHFAFYPVNKELKTAVGNPLGLLCDKPIGGTFNWELHAAKPYTHASAEFNFPGACPNSLTLKE